MTYHGRAVPLPDPAGASDERGDAELVRLARNGDHDAFAVVIRRHLGGAYSLALSLTASDAEASDACQLAMIKCWKRLGDCADPNRFAGWFMAVVRSTALDQTRARVRRRQVAMADVPELPDRSSGVVPMELRDTLANSIRTLPVIQRQVLLLADMEGWSHREIAAHLGCSEFMSRRHLSDARRRMRQSLGRRSDL